MEVNNMAEKKSEAQIKNEEEVKRVLKERGYSSSFNKRQVAEKFGGNFSIKSILAVVAILIIGGAVGWFFLQNNISGNDDSKKSVSNQELEGFQACLDAIDNSEISADDDNFWNKIITRYEQTISCYDKYPTVASVTEKNDLQNKLDEYREKSKQENANDIEYRESTAKSEKTYQESIINSKSEYEKEVTTTNTEQNNNKNSQSNTGQTTINNTTETNEEAQKQEQERAAKEKCDNYLATYGNSTPEELARNDSDVASKYNTWQNWLRQAQEVEGVQFTYQMCQSYWNRGRTCPSQYAGKAQEAEAEYNQILEQRIEYYRNLRVSSCGN